MLDRSVYVMTADYETYPSLKLDHLRAMTDDTGILQHAFYHIPRREAGYRTDDNAHALSAALLISRFRPLTSINGLALTYISFLEHALDGASGRFRDVMTFDRRWNDRAGSDDSHGRALLALGQAAAMESSPGLRAAAGQVFLRALSAVECLHSIRAKAFAMIGLCAYLCRFADDTSARKILSSLTAEMKTAYETHASADWPWPGQCLPCSSGQIAQAMILTGQVLGDPEATEKGLRTLHWLLEVQTGDRGYFAPIGDRQRYHGGKVRARFDQRPVDVHAMTAACISAFDVTGETEWAEAARLCFEWFLGRNDSGFPLFDPQTGGCCDGITPSGINPNQGAESTLSWLISLVLMQQLDNRLNPAETHFWFSE